MKFFDYLRRRDVQFWASLATIIALVVAILAWLFPRPIEKPGNLQPVATQTAITVNNSLNTSPIISYQVEEARITYFPWTRAITKLFQNSPQETWWLLGLVLCVSGMILGVGILLLGFFNENHRYGSYLILAVLAFWFSISTWGWWGVLIGFGLTAIAAILCFVNVLYGGLIGLVSGSLIGISIALAILATPGDFLESYLVMGNLLGGIMGAVLGAIAGYFFVTEII